MLFLDTPIGWVFSEVKRVGGLLTLSRLQTEFTELLASSRNNPGKVHNNLFNNNFILIMF